MQSEQMVDMQVWRVLDANLNRAGEGFRVLEELARLVQEDAQAAATLKGLRHELVQAAHSLDRAKRLSARSTEGDVGTQLTVGSESARVDYAAITSAECERIGQALRVLEEFTKLVDAQISQSFKYLRYRAYDDLAKIELKWSQQAWLKSLRLCILLDCTLDLARFKDYLATLCQAGARCVQIRDKYRDDRQLMLYARAAVEILDQYSGQVVINDRVDIALACGAAGVHVGQEDLELRDVRRVAGQRLAVGVSTHSLDQALAAQQAGADYIGCGPSFPSQTKHFEQFPGLEYLQQVGHHISIPALAIGGVTLDRLPQVLTCGVRGVAVSAAIHAAASPAEAVRQFCRALDESTVGRIQ